MNIKSRFRLALCFTDGKAVWLIDINTALLSKSLQRSATTSHWIPSQSFIPQGKWWSICLTQYDGDRVCVRTVEGKDGKSERASVWFCPTLRVLRDSSLCVEAWYTSVCVFHINVHAVCMCVHVCERNTYCMCVFFRGGRGIRPTKLVSHQLCSSRSGSVPASVQYFFQLPPPNGGSGRFYCSTLGRLLWPDPELLALCGLNVLWLWT